MRSHTDRIAFLFTFESMYSSRNLSTRSGGVEAGIDDRSKVLLDHRGSKIYTLIDTWPQGLRPGNWVKSKERKEHGRPQGSL
jgi:hypothetical protein